MQIFFMNWRRISNLVQFPREAASCASFPIVFFFFFFFRSCSHFLTSSVRPVQCSIQTHLCQKHHTFGHLSFADQPWPHILSCATATLATQDLPMADCFLVRAVVHFHVQLVHIVLASPVRVFSWFPWPEKKENLDGNQVRLMSCGTLPTSSSGVFFFPGFPWPARPLQVSLTSSLCCSESEDSFQRIEFVNSFQQQPVCRYLFFRVHLMI